MPAHQSDGALRQRRKDLQMVPCSPIRLAARAHVPPHFFGCSAVSLEQPAIMSDGSAKGGSDGIDPSKLEATGALDYREPHGLVSADASLDELAREDAHGVTAGAH